MAGSSGGRKRLEDWGQIGLGFAQEEMTSFPQSDWTPPDLDSMPDRLYGSIGIDTETCDEGLRAGHGAGWAWDGGGHVVGYSVTADNWSGYLPIAHEGGGNVDAGRARRWLNHVLSDDNQLKIFANSMYDIPWARRDGVIIRGPDIDVQIVEALLDEHRFSYALDDIAHDRIGERKDERLLFDAAAAHGFGTTNREVKSNIYKLHSRYVGPYGTWDSAAPRRIWAKQEPLCREQHLERIVALEHALLPMYIDMRRRGVRVDVPYAERLRERLASEVAAEVAEIKYRCGVEVSIWAADSIARVLKQEGIPYSLTKNSKRPSITQEYLESIDHWFTKAILRARERDKLVSTFIDGYVLGALHGGRVRSTIHPLKSDDGGTTTGRLSMSDPNLQNVPDKCGIRPAFLPEDGEECASEDHAQQEPRLLVHFACKSKLPDGSRLAGAEAAQQRYVSDPNMDYHNFASEITGLKRKPAKILNLAIIYGRGKKETARELGVSMNDAEALFERHDRGMPFARQLSKMCQERVRDRGFLTSLLGRRIRFPFWEPREWNKRDGRMLRHDDAEKEWGADLVHARIHKALNSLIQPSAADQMKMGMLAIWEAGLGRHVMIQVHDELINSVPDRAVADRIAEAMRDAVKLLVPSKIDVELGPTWMDSED
jgi:DNA polymerase I-like protein with 3'-5' exonuclease and polymerase domains